MKIDLPKDITEEERERIENEFNYDFNFGKNPEPKRQPTNA